MNNKKIFKSLIPIKVTHERGVDWVQTEGTVIKQEGKQVYLKGLIYDFSISKHDFDTKNIK